MANIALKKQIKDSSGNLLAGVAKTATFNSEALDLKGHRRVHVVLDIGTVSGTSPTLDIKWQQTLDGTTWIDHFPIKQGSETQAAFAQITATKEVSEWFDNPIGADGSTKVRLVWTIGGTSPSFTITDARILTQP